MQVATALRRFGQADEVAWRDISSVANCRRNREGHACAWRPPEGAAGATFRIPSAVRGYTGAWTTMNGRSGVRRLIVSAPRPRSSAT